MATTVHDIYYDQSVLVADSIVSDLKGSSIESTSRYWDVEAEIQTYIDSTPTLQARWTKIANRSTPKPPGLTPRAPTP